MAQKAINNKGILTIGECMMELSPNGNGFHRAFAGDAYNAAVYAKRFLGDLNVQFLTAIGTDPISLEMVKQWHHDGVGHDLTMTSNTANPGVYAISTDEQGERSFTYWRESSAATEMMALLTQTVRSSALTFNTIYFTGITLAILGEDDRQAFLDFISEARLGGAKIAFDPNYRDRLWQQREQAAAWISKAYSLTDIALPGLADHAALYDHQNAADIARFLQALGVTEIVVKAEDAGVYAFQEKESAIHTGLALKPNPIDTTGAGDAFAGTYLAARLSGNTISDAVHHAVRVSAIVVDHQGAIVNAEAYNKLIHSSS